MNESIQVSATLKAITAKGTGTVLQLELGGFTTKEDIADLYALRGKTVAVQIVDPEQPLPLEYEDAGDEDNLRGNELALVE